ncbi:hypothetical protein ABIB40_000635 [Pedobacter sp. UYP30]|uniref:hypothetical protein n=1 Tax=Pedobacter sp. UYP30 TaxID=1756400 RepID=UPI003392E320
MVFIENNIMIDPQRQNNADDSYSENQNDALRREDDTENIKELAGDDISIEADVDRLEQANEASKPSYELGLDDKKDPET